MSRVQGARGQDAATAQQTSSKSWKMPRLCGRFSNTHTHARRKKKIYTWERMCCRSALRHSCALGRRAQTYLGNEMRGRIRSMTDFYRDGASSNFEFIHEPVFISGRANVIYTKPGPSPSPSPRKAHSETLLSGLCLI